MRILFVYTLDDAPSLRTPIRTWDTIHLGISSIAAVLREDCHAVQLLVLPSNFAGQRCYTILEKVLLNFDPGIICFTTVSSQYEFVNKLAEFSRTIPGKRFQIVGGVHASLNPDLVINDCFDAVCVGEGEYPTREVVRQLASGAVVSGIPNMWIKNPDGTIEKNAVRPFLEPLDALPLIERDIWKPWIREPNNGRQMVLLGRGCPYNCTYCSNHALRKIAGGKYVRMRSISSIVKEIEALKHDFPGMKEVYLEVETIGADKRWLAQLCEALSALNSKFGEALSFGANYRITRRQVDEDVFRQMRGAGFSFVNIGLESGSERIRREILKRDYTNADFLETVTAAKKNGLRVNVYNMIGIPGETYSDHMETVKMNRLCQPNSHMTSILYPYEGTELFSISKEHGLIPDHLDATMERQRAALDLPGFSRAQIESAMMWFDYRIYKGHKPRLLLLYRAILFEMWRTPRIANLLRSIKNFVLS